jgi:hypothetical protein
MIIDAVKRNLNWKGANVLLEGFQAGAKAETHVVSHLDNLQPTVKLRYQVCSTRECDAAGTNQTPPKCTVLADTLTERTTLEVDREGRNLLRETKEIDGSVEQTRAELGVKVDGSRSANGTRLVKSFIEQSQRTYGSK